MHQRCRVATAATIAMLGCAGTATAQCDPTWDNTLGVPGITSGYIEDMIAWNDGTGEKLYVSGSATGINGNSTINYLGIYDPSNGQWSRPGGGIASSIPGQIGTNAFITKLLPWDDGTGAGERLYVAGQFATAGGTPETNSLAVWDGSTWTDLGAGFTNLVARVTYDMLPADLDGQGEKLYLVGNWTEIGGVPVGRGLAVYDPQDGGSYSQWGFGIGVDGSFSPFVDAMILWDDGSGPAIYIAGRFTSVDGAIATNVARYNIGSGQWEGFGQSLTPTGSTNNNTSFAIFDDGTGEALYLGGQQFRIGGVGQIFNVAKWNGTSWTGVGQQTSGRVTDLAVFDDGNGPALYAAGTAFFEVEYFAKLVGNQWVPGLGGVFGPPTNGNFPSAFGLYQWNDQLLVGGNFTRVGTDLLASRGVAAIQGCADAPCTGDIADDFGSLGADGQVSFGDFLALLGLIGPCPGGTPGCTGDIADDFGSLGGDGQVSFGDFLALLGLIGPCP